MIGNVVTSKADALVCHTKGEKHISYGELAGTTEHITL